MSSGEALGVFVGLGKPFTKNDGRVAKSRDWNSPSPTGT